MLHFKGKPYYQKVAEDLKEGAPEVLKFYQRAMKVMKEGNKDEFLKLYGPYSQETIKDEPEAYNKVWMNTTGHNAYRSVVRYIVDADPAYIIFYDLAFPGRPIELSIFFRFVRRVGEKEFQIVNLNLSNRFQQVMYNYDFVEKAIIPRLIADPISPDE